MELKCGSCTDMTLRSLRSNRTLMELKLNATATGKYFKLVLIVP